MTDAAIRSPCVDVCVMDRLTRLCIGCGRTAEEIRSWRGWTPAHRAEVMAALPARLAAMTTRKTRKAAGMRNDA